MRTSNRSTWAAFAAALQLLACTEGKNDRVVDAGEAGRPDAASVGASVDPAIAPEAPLPEPVRLLREADADLQRGRHQAAIPKLRRILEVQPGHAVAHNLLGRALMQQASAGDGGAESLAPAEQAFLSALDADPRFWPALQNLGELREATADAQGAADAYQKLLSLSPDHVERARYEVLIAAAKARAADAGAGAAAAKRKQK